MRPDANTAWGILVGLILFLAMAVTSVIAVKPNHPGITAMPSAAAGSTGEEAPPVDSKPVSWSSLDLNGDGQLSLAEAAGYAEIVTRFDRADRDMDGRLTRAEFQRLAKLPPPKAAGKARKPRRPEPAAAAGG